MIKRCVSPLQLVFVYKHLFFIQIGFCPHMVYLVWCVLGVGLRVAVGISIDIRKAKHRS